MDFNTVCLIYGDCGEVVNTAGCGPVMRGFDPHRPPHIRTGNRHRRFFYARTMGINGTCRKNKKEEMT